MTIGDLIMILSLVGIAVTWCVFHLPDILKRHDEEKDDEEFR